MLFASWDVSQLWTSPLEVFAVVTGLMCVTLLTFENWSPRLTWWNWPVGILNAAAYTYIFWNYDLYFNSVLQVFYVGAGFYGAWAWKRGGEDGAELTVNRLGWGKASLIASIATLAAAALAVALFDVFGVESAYPFLDALIVTLSVAAQFIMTRKFWEHWAFWITVDIIAVGLFWTQELYLTSLLYLVYGFLSTRGLFTWNAAYKQEATAAAVPS